MCTKFVLIILFRLLSVVLLTVCCPDFNPNRTTDSHLNRLIRTSCCIHMVVPPDDGSRYAQNM